MLTRDISDMLHRFFLKTGIIVLGTLHILKISYSFGLLKFGLGDIDTKSFECNDITILNCLSITCVNSANGKRLPYIFIAPGSTPAGVKIFLHSEFFSSLKIFFK